MTSSFSLSKMCDNHISLLNMRQLLAPLDLAVNMCEAAKSPFFYAVEMNEIIEIMTITKFGYYDKCALSLM